MRCKISLKLFLFAPIKTKYFDNISTLIYYVHKVKYFVSVRSSGTNLMRNPRVELLV